MFNHSASIFSICFTLINAVIIKVEGQDMPKTPVVVTTSVVSQEVKSLVEFGSTGVEVGTGIPVLSHIRGSEGITFPEVGSIVWDPNPRTLREPDVLGILITPIPTETPYQTPKSCQENKTLRQDVKSDLVEEKSPPIYDVLYVPEDLVPLDAQSVFGVKTKVFGYSSGADDALELRMSMDRVPCLPYRYRISNKGIYEDFGFNALKNYDKDPAAKGVYHPWVSRKIFGSGR